MTSTSDLQKVIKIAITGGPCAGKTTALVRLREWLEEIGFIAVVVPETATELMQNGITPGSLWRNNFFFQQYVLRYLLSREDMYEGMVKDILSHKPRVLLCDRGALDAAAYISHEMFEVILRRERKKRGELSGRYDGVIHLVTAADGAEEFYTLSTNSTRTETPEKARELDKRTQDAWVGHPHLRIVDNSTDFDGKIVQAKKAIARILGIPEPLEIERKFLVKSFDELPEHTRSVRIVQSYLQSVGRKERRIRERSDETHASYFYTEKEEVRPGVRIERERQISKREYRAFMSEEMGLPEIVKHRHCFIYKGQYFELDVFAGHLHGTIVLEIELTEEHDEVELPDFIVVEKEVTNDPLFTNSSLARRMN